MSASVERLEAALADRYRLERELGQGGMATVYLALDLKHNRNVAIKVLKPELAAVLGAERFLKEIETTAGLRHPHILPLYDSGTVGQGGPPPRLLYYVMPFVEGESLRDRLDREKQLPIEDALQIAREVADALGYAHSLGVVHRDIKPENILLERGHAVVADFGIARAVSSAGGERLTQTGMAVGTPLYMSPEQAAGDRIDGRSDLYALGSVLYEMLAGEPPYTGPTPQAIMAKRLMEPVPRISVVRETVPPPLELALTRVLAKAPADRPATASAFLQTLQGEGPTPPAAPPRRRWPWPPTARRPAMALSAVAAIAVLFGGYLLLGNRDPAGATLSPDLLAVVPFTVRGAPEVRYLGEGMVDLMSAKLDGAGPLTVVNPRVVIARINAGRLDIADPAVPPRIAREVGAGRYITGDILEAGGRVQFTAYLYRTGMADTAPARATAEGRADQLFELIDSLAAGLLAGALPDPAARLQRLAVTTSGTIPSLKEYLNGERLFRSGQYREAADAYDRAIALDTAFALAYYRKSLVAEWIDAYDARSSADRAFAYADRLSPRDRSLLAALRLRRHGRAREAEQAYRTHLHQWPDEVEALVQLGEILFHDGPRRGQTMADAMSLFQEALRLEPVNANARIHLARLYALYGAFDSLAADVRRFTADAAANAAPTADGGGDERVVEVRAIQAYATGDTTGRRDVVRAMQGRPWFYWFLAAHGVSRFARDAAGAQAMLDQRTTNEPIVLMLVANLLAVRGQERALRLFLDSVPGRTAQWDLLEAFLWTSGAVLPDTGRMRAVADRLRRADPGVLLRTNFVPAYEDLTVAFHRYERDFNVALLLIQLGRSADARPILRSLAAFDSMPALGDLQADALRSLEAEVHLAAGDTARALQTLRNISYEVPHGATYHAFADGSRSRFLRAELELAQGGDTATARGLFQGFDESWSPWDMYHRPVALRRLGEVAEARGEGAEAIGYYNRLLDLWHDCDPALVPWRDEVRQRRDALLRARG